MIIKKLNTVFHKHSKVLFGAITLVIIVSFVGFTSGGGMFGCDGYGYNGQAVGVVYGRKVSQEELHDFYRKVSVLNHSSNLGWQEVFELYCLDVRADQLGIHVSDDEVAKTIRRLPFCLNAKGDFDKNKYQTFLDTLKKQGVGEEELAEALRVQIKRGKLGDYILSQVTVTPSEVERLYKDSKTELRFRMASFDPKQLAAPTADELKTFFGKTKESFRCAKVAEIPVGKDAGAADKLAREFYREVGQKAEKFDSAAKSRKIKVGKAEWMMNDGTPLAAAIFNADARKPVAIVNGAKTVYVCCVVVKTDEEKFAGIGKQLETLWREWKVEEQAVRESERLNKIADRAAREKAFSALKNAKFSDINRPGFVSSIKEGDTVAAGNSVYLLRKRELPKTAMSEKEAPFYRERCRAMKGEAVWLAFDEDLRSNCKFMVDKEGRR